MTGIEIAIAVLLLLGALACLVSCAGILVMEDAFEKLHCLASAGILGTAAVAAAVWVQEGVSRAGAKVLIVLAVAAVGNPILTQVAGRAADRRRRPSREPGKGKPARQGRA
jgi:monovalent cation/proton antiporter MnhG/PhaG subunit